MRTKSYVTLSLALAVTPAIALANAAPPDSQPMPDKASKSSNKEAAIASWPADKQAAYEMWPPETKDYYWTLSPERQKLFWGLADTDKVTLSGMPPADQAKAWERIEGRGTSPSGSG